MKGFIEVHKNDGKPHLINIRHIVEVGGSTIYTDDSYPFLTDFPRCECEESYEEIKDKIARAERG